MVRTVEIVRLEDGVFNVTSDAVSVEEPMEIRLEVGGNQGFKEVKSLAVTMRTPGDDDALIRGFLLTEGIIRDYSEIKEINCVETNLHLVRLADHCRFRMGQLDRNFFMSSSCGICGKASIEAVSQDPLYLSWSSKLQVTAARLSRLPLQLLERQAGFSKTGGIHACALFNEDGITFLAEDVGRHNALDKLIGRVEALPITQGLVLSGRASFELVQKAAVVGVPLVAAIGAPSSLAVDLAQQSGMTLIGFLKGNRCNIYTHPERVIGAT